MPKKSLAGLLAVAAVVVGVAAYQSTAFGGGEKCMSKSASAGEASCAAQAQKASGKSDCCAAKGASQASAGEHGASVVPVGGSSCAAKATGASHAGASCPMTGTTSAKADENCHGKDMAECGGCELYKTYWTSLEKAGFEMKSIDNGIVVTFTSEDPAVLAELVKYATAKAEMYRALRTSDEKKGCSICQEKASIMKEADFAVATDKNAVRTTITAEKPATVEGLHKLVAAQHATEQAASDKAQG